MVGRFPPTIPLLKPPKQLCSLGNIAGGHHEQSSRMPTQELDMLTSRQAADLLGYTVQHVRRLVRSGTLRGIKHGRDWVVEKTSVEQYLADRENIRLPLRVESDSR